MSGRGLPDFFVTLTVYDKWPHVQSTIARGWGAEPTAEEFTDLAGNNTDRQAVGWHSHVWVTAAKKRFNWIMGILCSPDSQLGHVQDYFRKKEYQKRGSVHWHMLFWVKPGTAPEGVVLAEVPRGLDTSHPIAVYLRKVVLQMQMHGKCNSTRYSTGRPLANASMAFHSRFPTTPKNLTTRRFAACTSGVTKKTICSTIQPRACTALGSGTLCSARESTWLPAVLGQVHPQA